jgi:hypothetical protein
MPMSCTTTTLSGVGRSAPFAVNPAKGGILLPTAMVFLSPGASLTYSVEVTGDDVTAPGYVAANGNWFVMDGMNALTAAANETLIGACMGICIHITNWVSGTATFAFCTEQ